jgi:hypothetical protein
MALWRKKRPHSAKAGARPIREALSQKYAKKTAQRAQNPKKEHEPIEKSER